MTEDKNAGIKASIRTLWDTGISAAQIGARLGLTKNSVVGHAHRMDLPGRASPIIRDGRGRAPRRPKHTLPDLSGPTPDPSGPLAELEALAREVRPPMPTDAKRECQWITTARKPWGFCCAPVAVGRSWCPVHLCRVFQATSHAPMRKPDENAQRWVW